jgi:hypothetical protein
MNPTEDWEARKEAALRAFDEALDWHEQCMRAEGAALKAYRYALARGWPVAVGRTEAARKDWVEAEAADEEETLKIAEGATRAAMELVRLRRDEYGMVRTEMANQREEKGITMRDGGYRGA